MTPGASDLWFLPLGGCGEIGINFNLYGHDGRWLIVDCGIGFDRRPGASAVIAPEPDFIAARRDQIAGMVITHAHEDHVGAVHYLWPELRCPVYATPYTAAILRRKLADADLLDRVPLHVVKPGERFDLDGFRLRFIGVTHSTPESQCLVVETDAGRVLHTGDWKWDDYPQVGPAYDRDEFTALASAGVDVLVCDSTCATVPGRSPSEADLLPGLSAVLADSPGRVIAACFGSNIARLHTLARLGAQAGRYTGLLGRSLVNNYSAARSTGYWDPELVFADPKHLGYLPAREVLAIATGSQGEPRAALTRLAAGTHPQMELETDDTVLFSSRVIPGNEEAITRLRNRLEERGVRVVEQTEGGVLIHASGHPARDELIDMYRWVQPRQAIPVHGEPHHLRAHAELARDCGVPRTHLGGNGDLFMVAPVPGIRRAAAPVGRRVLRDVS